MRIKSKKDLLELIINKELGITKSVAFKLSDSNENENGWYRGYLDACKSIYDSIDNLYFDE